MSMRLTRPRRSRSRRLGRKDAGPPGVPEADGNQSVDVVRLTGDMAAAGSATVTAMSSDVVFDREKSEVVSTQ